MVADDLALRLEQAGIGTVGTDIFKYVSPDGPDAQLTIIPYSGDEPDRVQEKRKVEAENPRVQVAARGDRPEEVTLLIERAYQALMVIENEVINGVYYQWCDPVDTPSIIGRDESGRHLATVNFRVKKELTSV